MNSIFSLSVNYCCCYFELFSFFFFFVVVVAAENRQLMFKIFHLFYVQQNASDTVCTTSSRKVWSHEKTAETSESYGI